MISPKLLEELHKLSSLEKLQVIQLLAGDLRQEAGDYFAEGTSYEIWSPYEAGEAASILLDMLSEDENKNG